MKLSEIRDNTFGVACAMTMATLAAIGSPTVIAIELHRGKSLRDSLRSVDQAVDEAGEMGFEWGKENAETAAALTGLALGISGFAARHRHPQQPPVGGSR